MKSTLSLLLLVATFSLPHGAAHAGEPVLEPTASLPPGTWGAVHQGLTVFDGGFSFQSDCAVARFEGTFALDPDGNFDLRGELHSMMGIVVHPGLPQAPRPVRYLGSVKGDQMAVTILLTDENIHVGTFILEQGQDPVLFFCQ